MIAYTSRPPEIPQGRYCNECVEIPPGVPNTMSDPVTGEFELLVAPGGTYYLTIQKGEFRRVREYSAPDTPGSVVQFTWDEGGPRPELTTLPNRTDLERGDNIPKIAVIRGGYENMRPMFDVLGFNYNHDGPDFDIYCAWNPFNRCPGPGVRTLLNDPAVLDQYNLIIVSCGEDWPGNTQAAENLQDWVMNGGSLYVDDFNYDFVEKPWPDFLAWYVADSEDDYGETGPCADGGHTSVGDCNNWSSYNFNGAASDVPEFASWLALPSVNRGQPLRLLAAWDYLYQLGEGLVGFDEETGQEIHRTPRVWMYNEDIVPWDDSHVPATVSWPYYCGRVLYTVYHTHSEGAGADYELLLQEKIMMYLIMEVQTCATADLLY